MSTINDAELYCQYFSVVPATTQELLLKALRLRYQVYCVEHAYEDPADQTGELEMDEYDMHSAHAVLIYRPTGAVCGCVRLVLPRRERTLPIVRVMDAEGLHTFRGYPRAVTAEVSRYAVSKEFRRRLGEGHIPDVGFFDLSPNEMRRMRPHLTLGLMLGIAKLSVAHDIRYLAAVMADPLLRLLSGFGMGFTTLGSPILHHGMRQPCIANCADLLFGMEKRCPSYFRELSSEFSDLRCSLSPMLITPE